MNTESSFEEGVASSYRCSVLRQRRGRLAARAARRADAAHLHDDERHNRRRRCVNVSFDDTIRTLALQLGDRSREGAAARVSSPRLQARARRSKKSTGDVRQ
jgi:hypothetical protein